MKKEEEQHQQYGSRRHVNSVNINNIMKRERRKNRVVTVVKAFTYIAFFIVQCYMTDGHVMQEGPQSVRRFTITLNLLTQLINLSAKMRVINLLYVCVCV